ncbi:MAG: hypothetical protein D6754_04115 [Alphaproteobacteria bacterium]|nr:MAG: hypothetical protein D6754_04115 [Alphaproteobacteria bacterium]
MSAFTTEIPAPQPARRKDRGQGGLVAWLMELAERAYRHSDAACIEREIAALDRLSDAELAARGLRRE